MEDKKCNLFDDIQLDNDEFVTGKEIMKLIHEVEKLKLEVANQGMQLKFLMQIVLGKGEWWKKKNLIN